jgi:hypothetical protein
MKLQRLVVLVATVALAGCGRVAELRPIKGQEPVKPLMARAAPTTEQLLALPPYAKPTRVDELVKRSEPRKPDPFDLPPPTGSAAPALPAGMDPMPVDKDTGPSTPQ